MPKLLARVPAEMRVYAEPFAGGAALFFALAGGDRTAARARSFKRAIVADRNEDLIGCYRAVRDDVGGVVNALRSYRYDRELFYSTRDLDPGDLSAAERAARLIFLNRTCFNGLWRVNAAGKFNVPFGRYVNPRILDEAGLRSASRALQGVELVTSDFVEVTERLRTGDFAYLDPPYVPLTKTSDFTAYVPGGFGCQDHERLAEQFRNLRARGVLAMLSNADTPTARELYKDFAIAVVCGSRPINSNANKRGEVSELLVTTWGSPGIVEVRMAGSARRRAALERGD